ncbi:Uve UV damage repair endonuclease [uncultured Caudovirales phage]|uniref:Uve UV damage repair endonuclease n=1 Tax=uncultured Caudovirales phage TaxID=2100421 RepID=A0A6J5R1B6_9CAUD|nr:Uve UV damage repair endonuclease [uncultured Caudovirales phage]CAB4165574.1 Uve UV damage repair endonuclease [uncultured Caudovirales phage]CAB4186775.1 Uve UV damage repair endonuclease [uncultured Caudovirales phage]CAB4220583.1 Uve UV damage repair endonuclease [uncultured Caudovirales phage]
MRGKIGFACKYVEITNSGVVSIPHLNTGSTTVAWLNRQTREVAEQRLWDLMKRNIEATHQLVKTVGELDDHLRMVRIGSDILPVYTHSDWSWFWRQSDVIAYAETHFAEVGRVARACNVRLSFHPGQFVVLASATEDIVNRSIEEFEYHATMANWMGFGKSFQDFKINVHISGRQGPEGIRRAWKKLSVEARNCITIENEEITHGLADCLSLADIVPCVLDIHHHFIREGEYIQPDDDRVQQVIDSWRGHRPTMHYSVSREDLLPDHPADILPDLGALLLAGHKKQKLRAHSDFMWNTAVNKWAGGFCDQFDIMVEAKGKNLARDGFVKQLTESK